MSRSRQLGPAATILDYARAKPGLTIDGHSLRRPIERPSERSGRGLLTESWCHYADDCFDRDAPLRPRFKGVHTQRYSYLEYPATGERELYDLKKDPGQLESKHDSSAYRSRERTLARLLDQLRDC